MESQVSKSTSHFNFVLLASIRLKLAKLPNPSSPLTWISQPHDSPLNPPPLSTPSMPMRRPLLISLLFLILLLLLLHGWSHLRPQSTALSSVPRKVLAAKFDSSAFHYTRHSQHHHHHHRRHHHRHQHGQARHSTVVEVKPGPDQGDKIDPRFGVEKRRVPTGPNPLHH